MKNETHNDTRIKSESKPSIPSFPPPPDYICNKICSFSLFLEMKINFIIFKQHENELNHFPTDFVGKWLSTFLTWANVTCKYHEGKYQITCMYNHAEVITVNLSYLDRNINYFIKKFAKILMLQYNYFHVHRHRDHLGIRRNNYQKEHSIASKENKSI